MELKAFFTEHPTVAVAFSGGTDSAYLLYAAKQCAAEVRAYYAQTAFQPQFELDDARRERILALRSEAQTFITAAGKRFPALSGKKLLVEATDGTARIREI